MSNLEIRKDKNSKEEKIFNKETGFPIKNIINIKKPENKNVLINKRNNQELNNIIQYKDDKNKKEICTKIDIIIPLNKDYIELKCEKDTITGNEILVNKNTGEKLDKIEIKNNKENGEKIFINKDTREIILGINKIKNPNTKNESYIYIYEKSDNKTQNKRKNNKNINNEYNNEKKNINKSTIKNNFNQNNNNDLSNLIKSKGKNLDKINELRNLLLKVNNNISNLQNPLFENNDKNLIESRIKKEKLNSDLILENYNSGILKKNELPYDNIIDNLLIINKSSSKSPNNMKNYNSDYNNLKFSNKKNFIDRKNSEFKKCVSQKNLSKSNKNEINLNITSNGNKFNNNNSLKYNDINYKFNEKKFQNLKSIYNETNYISNENYLNGSSYSNNNKKKLKEKNKYIIYDKEKNPNEINKFSLNTERNLRKENKKFLKKNLSPDLHLINMIATKYLFDYKPTPSAKKGKYFSPKINFYTPNSLKIYENEKQNINLKLFQKNNDINVLSNLNYNSSTLQNNDNFYIYDDSKIEDIMKPNTIDSEKFKYFKK